MTPGVAERIFIWSYSDTAAYTLETCDWCEVDSFGPFQSMASQLIRNELDNFYAEFSEWFNLAEFPDVQEQLQPSEVALFLKSAGAPDGIDLALIENYDCFSGLREIIHHRLDWGSLEQLKAAADLLNWTIGFGLSSCDTNAKATIKVGSVEDVRTLLAGPNLEPTSRRPWEGGLRKSRLAERCSTEVPSAYTCADFASGNRQISKLD